MSQINFALDFASRKAKNSLKRGGHRGSSAPTRNTNLKTRSKKQTLSKSTLPESSSIWVSSSRIPEETIKVSRNTNHAANDTVNPRPHVVEPIQEQKHCNELADSAEASYAVWIEYYLSRLPVSSGKDHDNRSRQKAAVHIISAQLERLVPNVMNMLNVHEGIEYAERFIDLGKDLIVLGETIQEAGESWKNEKID